MWRRWVVTTDVADVNGLTLPPVFGLPRPRYPEHDITRAHLNNAFSGASVNHIATSFGSRTAIGNYLVVLAAMSSASGSSTPCGGGVRTWTTLLSQTIASVTFGAFGGFIEQPMKVVEAYFNASQFCQVYAVELAGVSGRVIASALPGATFGSTTLAIPRRAYFLDFAYESTGGTGSITLASSKPSSLEVRAGSNWASLAYGVVLPPEAQAAWNSNSGSGLFRAQLAIV